MGMFWTNTMTLQLANGTVIQTDLPVQLDTVNIPLELMANRLIPVDMYDLYSIGWVTPVPTRANYFLDQDTGIRYSVYGNPSVYTSHLEVRIVKYTGPN